MRKLLRISALIAALALFFYLDHRQGEIRRQSEKPGQFSSLFSEVASIVRQEYMVEVDPVEKFPSAYESLLTGLDSQSAYLDPGQTGLFRRLGMSRLCHPGIWGGMGAGQFRIARVESGSAADKSGLRRGDIILSINGKDLRGRPYWNVRLALSTPEPSQLILQVKKEGGEDPITLRVQTEFLLPASVIKDLGDGTFLVRLDALSIQAAQEIEGRLRGQVNPGLIIDLTRYRCGDLQSFQTLCRLFFPKEALITLVSKQQSLSIGTGSVSPIPYRAVVIVDETTREYGELLAALFQRHHCPLIGKPTAGCSSRLRQFHLADGSSILLPTGHFSLAGNSLRQVPITPDRTIADDRLSQAAVIAQKMLKGEN